MNRTRRFVITFIAGAAVAVGSVFAAVGVAAETRVASQVKSPHFVSSSPRHGAKLPRAPRQVSLDFDFDLASGSKVKVRKGSKVVSGRTKIAGDSLRLVVPVSSAGKGAYNVTYTACWPDGSCHNGRFSYTVR